MSLHAIEIAAVVTVAIAVSRFSGLLWCNSKPLAADVAGVKMPMQNLLKLFCVIAWKPCEYVEPFPVADL
jgi:hypothetical protein